MIDQNTWQIDDSTHATATDERTGRNPIDAGTGTPAVEQTALIDRVSNELTARFPTMQRTRVQRVVTEEFARFNGSAVTTFVPILATRASAARLASNDNGADGTLTAPAVFASVVAPE